MSLRNVTYPAAVLVVDDEPVLLEYAVAALRRAGFFVFSASCPADAIDIESVYPGEIGLLLSAAFGSLYLCGTQ